MYPNHVWSWDFIEDSTESGRKIRFLTVIDEYTRESLAIEAGKSFGADDVIDVLEWLCLTRGTPGYIRSDNGPEFVAKKVQEWLRVKGCGTIYITPGSPWENPRVESFNGSLRDECLNMHVFGCIQESQAIVEAWRRKYNEERPHSALGYLTPAEFASLALHRRRVPTGDALSGPTRTASAHWSTCPSSYHDRHSSAHTTYGYHPIIPTGTRIGGKP